MDKKKKRMWSLEDEHVLIDIWKEKIVELRNIRKNSGVVEEMLQELLSCGIATNATEIRSKMHNLTTKYKKEKLSTEPSEWPLYSKLQEVFSPFESNKDNCDQSNNYEKKMLDKLEMAEVVLCDQPNNYEKKMLDKLEDVAASIVQLNEDFKTFSEDLLAVEKKRNNILERNLEENTKIHKALIELLSKR